jgi:hypothetical protein
MLAAVDVAQCLSSVLAMALFKLLVPIEVLVPLKPIEKNASEGLVEILLDSSDDFFKNVCVCRARTAMHQLRFLILVEELCDGNRSRSRRDFVLLRDFLPVVYQDRLESVWNEDLDSRSAHELIFL